MNDGKVVISTELDTKSFDAQIKSLELELETIDKRLAEPKKYGLSKDDIADLTVRAERLNNKLKDLYDRREKLNNQPSKLSEWSEDFGRSLTKSIAKIGRLALGIFGIRSAYNAVRNAMSVISENDEQLKADIDYMKNTLAYVLEPVVRRIVDLFKTLMFYVGYIAKAWFGVNIYAKASQKALANGAKSAKEIHKQLAGFDEMNVLQDSSSSGGSGATTPSFDLGDLDKMKTPEWLEWIGKHGQDLIPILLGIASGLLAIKLGLDPLTSLGIGIAIWGIVKAMQEIDKYIKDPDWKKFGNTLMYIGIAVVGIGIAFSNLPTIIAGAGIAIVGATVRIWDQLHEGADKFIKRLEGFNEYLELTTDSITRYFYDAIIGTIRFLFDGIELYMTSLRNIFDGIINFVTGIFTKNWEKAWTGVVQVLSGILGVMTAVFMNSVGVILKLGVNLAVAMAKSIGDTLKNTINIVLRMIESFVNSTISAINKAISLINAIPGVKIGLLAPVHLPKLAQGGIVNNPGPGVMMGSYIAGERGPEAVLPLTDDTLQRLANMIPITVNLTNTMNGRVISRELQKVQNENNFAFNR